MTDPTYLVLILVVIVVCAWQWYKHASNKAEFVKRIKNM